MEPECYPSSILPHTSRLYEDYTRGEAALAAWYAAMPAAPAAAPSSASSATLSASTLSASTRSSSAWMREGREPGPVHRARLADLLDAENRRFGGGARAAAAIGRLRAGASAVVTGQQVTLFGGPLYVLLKAATAIVRAEEATASGYDTVPVFWLASEDHDFAEAAAVALRRGEELETLRLTPPPARPVPVGGIVLGARIAGLVEQAAGLLGEGEAAALLRAAYEPQATMAEAFGRLLARIFAPWGLIVLDAAARPFHQLGAPVLERALREADALHAALLERGEELVRRDYHAQVAVGDEPGLLFLLEEETGARLPLRRTGWGTGRATGRRPGAGRGPETGEWRCGARLYSTEELLGILAAAPERLSPNALLRPVFEDAILPTSAYVGGPAEVAYFAQSEVLYRALLARPTAILPRLSATLVDPRVAARMERHGVRLPEAMTTADALAMRLGARAMPVEGKRRLAVAGNALDAELRQVTEWMAAMDEGLGRSAAVAASKMRYQMNRLRRMAARFEVEREASLARHARAITSAVFPGGHPQERAVAGISFLASEGMGLAGRLVEAAADPCPGHRLLPL